MLYPRKYRSFLRDDRGYVTIEVLIFTPLLLLIFEERGHLLIYHPTAVIFGACWVFFDAMRQQNVNQKANYVISDMISRETDPLDDIFVDGSFGLFNSLTQSYGEETAMRISVARYNRGPQRWVVYWSETRGDKVAMQNKDLQNIIDRMPRGYVHNEHLILVETWEHYDPVLDVGLGPFDIRTYSFTKPRYAPQVAFYASDENNGWGNGDQDASGGSADSNCAENYTDGCTNMTN